MGIVLLILVSGCVSQEKDILKNQSPKMKECLDFLLGEKVIKELSEHTRPPTDFEKATIENCASLTEEEKN